MTETDATGQMNHGRRVNNLALALALFVFPLGRPLVFKAARRAHLGAQSAGIS